MEAVQLKAQENKPEDSKALAELLNKQKVGRDFRSLQYDKDSTYSLWSYETVFPFLYRSSWLKLNKNRAASMNVKSSQSNTHPPSR